MSKQQGLSPEDRRREVEARFVEAGRWRDFIGEVEKLWVEDVSDGTCQVRNALAEFAVGKLDSLLGGEVNGTVGVTEDDVYDIVAHAFQKAFPFSPNQVQALQAVADRYLERAVDNGPEEDAPVPPPRTPIRQPIKRGQISRTSASTEPEHVPVRIPLPRGPAMEALMNARAQQDSQAALRNLGDRQRRGDSGAEHDLG